MSLKRVFVDTNALMRNQKQPEDPELLPIIVQDVETNAAERTSEVEIRGLATLRYEMWPAHNLARVWIEADSDGLQYEGEPTEWPHAADSTG